MPTVRIEIEGVNESYAVALSGVSIESVLERATIAAKRATTKEEKSG